MDAAAPAPAAAADEHVPFDFDDLVVGNSRAAAPAPAPTAVPTSTEEFVDEAQETRAPRPPYDGLSYSWGTFTFRPAEFKFEACSIAIILAYLLLSMFGAAQNKAHASAWFASNNAVLQDELAGVGFGAKPFAEDSKEFLTYATGRRGVSSVWVNLKTKARHDIFTKLYHTARGLLDQSYVSGEDRVVSLFAPSRLDHADSFDPLRYSTSSSTHLKGPLAPNSPSPSPIVSFFDKCATRAGTWCFQLLSFATTSADFPRSLRPPSPPSPRPLRVSTLR